MSMRLPKDYAAPKQEQTAVEYIWEQRGCVQQRREPIVRCRDCRHFKSYENSFEPNLGYCREHDREEVLNYWFCAWGERKADA